MTLDEIKALAEAGVQTAIPDAVIIALVDVAKAAEGVAETDSRKCWDALDKAILDLNVARTEGEG